MFYTNINCITLGKGFLCNLATGLQHPRIKHSIVFPHTTFFHHSNKNGDIISFLYYSILLNCDTFQNRDEMMKQLSCESSTEGLTEATSSNTWDNDQPTRHRRDTDVTVDMASSQHLVPTTEGE